MVRPGLQWIDAQLERRSRHVVLGVALLFAILVGVADHFLKPDLLVLYLLPLFLAAWYGGIRPGLMVAVYAAGATFVTQAVVTGSTEEVDLTGVVTLVIRLLAYLAIVFVVARLRESRRQQQDLVGFLVHDLRSPISSAITGLMTLEQTSESLRTDDREMVELALVSNHRALNLVNSILDVAKLESGKMEVRVAETDLATLVEECIQGLSLWAKGNGVEFASDVQVPKAWLDRDLTARVLTNLMSNALKFSPEGGTITIRVEPDAHGVKFTVSDQGPGIPPDYVETIFEPFAQVKGTKGGTGLGLTFCRLAVRGQGGRIGVQSTLGQGSTFWFTLPQHPR